MESNFNTNQKMVTKKWKTAFFICLFLLLGTIGLCGFIVIQNTILSGHSWDVLHELEADIEIASTLMKDDFKSYEKIDKHLSKLREVGYAPSSDKSNIRLTHLKLLFNKNGQWIGMTTGSVQE